MKRLWLVLSAVVLLASLAFAKNTADAPDFRNVVWGMTQAEVIRAETAATLDEQGDDYLWYKDVTIDGKKCALLYLFKSGRLNGAGYFFVHKHTNLNDFIDDFQSIKSLLTKKYGAPASDDVIWKNDLFKDDYQNWGSAIAMGHLVYRAAWETERTLLILSLSGDNYEIDMLIGYYSKLDGDESADNGSEDLDNV